MIPIIPGPLPELKAQGEDFELYQEKVQKLPGMLPLMSIVSCDGVNISIFVGFTMMVVMASQNDVPSSCESSQKSFSKVSKHHNKFLLIQRSIV